MNITQQQLLTLTQQMHEPFTLLQKVTASAIIKVKASNNLQTILRQHVVLLNMLQRIIQRPESNNKYQKVSDQPSNITTDLNTKFTPQIIIQNNTKETYKTTNNYTSNTQVITQHTTINQINSDTPAVKNQSNETSWWGKLAQFIDVIANLVTIGIGISSPILKNILKKGGAAIANTSKNTLGRLGKTAHGTIGSIQKILPSNQAMINSGKKLMSRLSKVALGTLRLMRVAGPLGWSLIALEIALFSKTVREKLSQWFDNTIAWLASTTQQIQATLDLWFDSATTWLTSTMLQIQTTLSQWFDNTTVWLASATQQIQATLGLWFDSATTWLTSTMLQIQTALSQWFDNTTVWLASATQQIQATLGLWFDSAATWVTSTVAQEQKKLSDGFAKVKSWFTAKNNTIKDGDIQKSDDATPTSRSPDPIPLLAIPLATTAIALKSLNLDAVKERVNQILTKLKSWFTQSSGEPPESLQQLKEHLQTGKLQTINHNINVLAKDLALPNHALNFSGQQHTHYISHQPTITLNLTGNTPIEQVNVLKQAITHSLLDTEKMLITKLNGGLT